MTDPTSLTAVVQVRADTPVEVQSEPHGNWSLTLGNWPAVLSLYGSRDELRGVLHRALGELAKARCEVCEGHGEYGRYLGEGEFESHPCDACSGTGLRTVADCVSDYR